MIVNYQSVLGTEPWSSVKETSILVNESALQPLTGLVRTGNFCFLISLSSLFHHGYEMI